jgi:hypothetical protein
MDARKTSIILFAAVSATVLLATFTGLPPDWKPAGVERPAPMPSLRPRSLMSGNFGVEFERHFAQKFGVRGYGIRLAHQLSWDFFGTLPPTGGTIVDRGKDHGLFEHEYSRHHVHRYEMKKKEAVEFAARMATLKEHLAKRGIPLVVCISPSKAAVYPEYLPDDLAPSAGEEGNTPARDLLVKHLRHAHVAVVDSRARFKKMKKDGVPLFARNGTHWNAYGAQRIFNTVVSVARRQNPSLPPVPKVIGHVAAAPLRTDHDLSALYNMIRYPYTEKAVPYPVFEESATNISHRLRILGVGDSFSFQLADAMGRCGAVESFRLLYYNKADYRFAWSPDERPRENKAEHHRQPSFDARHFDIDEATQDCDLVLVELNDIFARKRAWGFGSGLSPEPNR